MNWQRHPTRVCSHLAEQLRFVRNGPNEWTPAISEESMRVVEFKPVVFCLVWLILQLSRSLTSYRALASEVTNLEPA